MPDLKPTNVLVVGSTVKLVDFGIADAIGANKRLAGTVEFMAPELFLGVPASALSDLYAVGVIAFQLFTGTIPYRVTSQIDFLEDLLGDSMDATLSPDAAQILGTYVQTLQPTSAEALAAVADRRQNLLARLTEQSEVALPLTEIVMRLLARDPAERYSSAVQVIEDLSRALNEPLPVETAATRESFLQAAEFIGRTKEFDELSAVLERTLSGRGGVVMVCGESGVGKSRLVSELRTTALVRSIDVVAGQGTREKGGNYDLWTPILRTLCLDAQLEPQEIGIFMDVAPDLEALLGRRAQPPASLSPQAAVTRLYRTIGALLKRRSRPLLILLDDLHWAGAESLELLAYLASVVRELPVLILGTYRSDEASPMLRRLPALRVVQLGRLGEEDVARLAVSMLGAVGREPTLIQYLLRHTEGNVFFLVEVVRALGELAGQLDRITASALPEHLLTGGIERIVERRLGRIAGEDHELLSLAAVAGRQLDFRVLQQASGISALGPWFTRCANASLLEISQGSWQFTHEKIREVLLREVPVAESQRLHRRVAEAIIAVYGEDQSRFAILGYHYSRAGAAERAYETYLKAAQASTRLHAVVEARSHCAAALAELAYLPDTPANRRRRADTLVMLVGLSVFAEPADRLVEWMVSAEGVLRSLQEAGCFTPEDQARLAKVYFWTGRGYFFHGLYDRAIESYKKTTELARELGDKTLLALSTGMIGQALVLQGRILLCWPYLEESAKSLELRGRNTDWARMVGFQGIALAAQGQATEALERVNCAIAVASDPTFLATTYGYLCLVHVFLEDWAALRGAALQTTEVAREGRDAFARILALALGGWAESWLGESEESARHHAEAWESYSKMNSGMLFEWILAARAEQAVHAGRLDEAIAEAQAGLAKAEAVGAVYGEGLAHRAWARALLAHRPPRWAEAKLHLTEAIRRFEEGGVLSAIAHTRRLWAEASAACGETGPDWGLDLPSAPRQCADS